MQNQTSFQFAPAGFINQNDIVTTEINERNLDPRPGVRMSTVVLPSNLLYYAKSIGNVMKERNAVMTQLDGFTATFAHFETEAEGRERASNVQERLNRRRTQFASELAQVQDTLRSVQNELKRLNDLDPSQVRAAPMAHATQQTGGHTETFSWDTVGRTESGLN